MGRGSRRRALHRRRLHRPCPGCAARRLRHLEGRGAARSAGDPVRQEHDRRRDQICDQAAFEHPRGPHHLEPGDLQHPGVPGQFQRTARQGQAAGKASFAKLTRDGYGTNLYQDRDVSDKDTTAYRLALEWLPSDKVSFGWTTTTPRTMPSRSALTRLESNPFCWVYWRALRSAAEPLRHRERHRSGQQHQVHRLLADSQMGHQPGLLFKSITAYRETDTQNWIDFDTSPPAIADSEATYYDDQTTQEFQLIYTGSDKWSGVLGFYYFDGTGGRQVEAIFYHQLPEHHRRATRDQIVRSLCAMPASDLTDRLTLNLGLRPTRGDEARQGLQRLQHRRRFQQTITSSLRTSTTRRPSRPGLPKSVSTTTSMLTSWAMSR